MKVVCVLFLAFCAVSAELTCFVDFDNKLDSRHPNIIAIDEAEVLERLQEIIQDIVERLRQALNNAIEKLKLIVSKIRSKLDDAIEEARDRLKEAIAKIKDHLNEWEKQSEIARNCTKQHQQEIQEIVQNAHEDLVNCINNGQQELKQVVQLLDEQRQKALELVIDVKSVIDNCASESITPIGTVACVLKKASALKEQVEQTIADITNGLMSAASLAQKIVSESSQCTKQTISTAENALNKVVQQIQNCIQENQMLFAFIQ